MAKQLGQYFTTVFSLKTSLYTFILNKPENILEPSIGRGDLIEFVQEKMPEVIIDMYEIDPSIKFLKTIDRSKITFGDFLKQNILKTYQTIIGNPPYVKKSHGNLYIEFIEKCYNLLAENGELIFIVPSDLFNLSHARRLLNNMMDSGVFTHIFHPHNEKLFENASIDVLIFRYCKNKYLPKTTLHNGDIKYIINSSGYITFVDEILETTKISNYFDVYVGLVSGKDSVFRNETIHNMRILTAENTYSNYIYIEKFPSDNLIIDEYLLRNKQSLLDRKIRNFNESNWFEFGAPRNIKTIREFLNSPCIYMYNLTRKNKISFAGRVDYFGGNLIMLKPKQEYSDGLLDYFNSDEFKNKFIFSGRFKIGHNQLLNAQIPIEKIEFP